MAQRKQLTIGARASALSWAQALLVGEALRAAHPRLQVDYQFIEAAGDRDLDADLPQLLRSGGFTNELSAALCSGVVDVAVHSWKDLPFTASSSTFVAATLERADIRDVLLVRRAWCESPGTPLRVFTCSARRRENLATLLQWALPGGACDVEFAPVRGDVVRRLNQLLAGEADALVVAKAALDRLLTAGGESFAAARARVRECLAACGVMVLPLSHMPAAPGQGALAIEIGRGRADIEALLAAIHHAPSFERVQRERAWLAPTADEDHPCGISIVPHSTGDIQFRRGRMLDRTISFAALHRTAPPLPKAATARDIWIDGEDEALGTARLPLPTATSEYRDPNSMLLVARADALPSGYRPPPGQVVWTAGVDTWRTLAAQGLWVNGTDDGLGEGAARNLDALFPHVNRSIKLSHAEGFDSIHSERIATYRVAHTAAPRSLIGRTHFYWRSGSRFLGALRAYPWLKERWHGCGPGNSLRLLEASVGADRVRAFLTSAAFRAEVLG
jgi:hydroxymethylbilane synthase